MIDKAVRWLPLFYILNINNYSSLHLIYILNINNYYFLHVAMSKKGGTQRCQNQMSRAEEEIQWINQHLPQEISRAEEYEGKN
jgi:hypothetical protein